MRSRGNWKARPKLKSLRQENRDVHLKIVGAVNSPFVLTAAGDPARIFGPEVPKADTGSGAAWVCSGGLAPAPEGGASGSDDIAATAEAPGGTAASLGGATSGHAHIALDSGFRIFITQFCCSLSRFLIRACLVSCSSESSRSCPFQCCHRVGAKNRKISLKNSQNSQRFLLLHKLVPRSKIFCTF